MKFLRYLFIAALAALCVLYFYYALMLAVQQA